MPAQFALRVAILGGVGLVAFAIIFFRLWYLEVLSGDQYRAEAQNNQVREFTVQAPRGDIVDRRGQTLVDNRTALELQVKTTDLPQRPAVRARLFRRVGEVANLRPAQIRHKIRAEAKECAACPVTLRRDVAYDTVYYVRENQRHFPGVSVQRVYVRHYPQGTLAAHLLGYAGEVDTTQLEDPRYEALQPGDQVGRSGVEQAYDSLLRGTNGVSRVQVDAAGQPTGGRLSERQPEAGNNLVLTIDDAVESAGESAIASTGLPGGFVAMNIHDGQLYGLGSSPSYDPSTFAKPRVPQATYNALTNPALGNPLFDRATNGFYPTGSTFKPITALAALDSGKLTLSEIINDPGEVTIGDQVFENAGHAVNGAIDLRDALKVSSDVFFYTLGARMNVNTGDGGPLQQWARALGIGQPTGLDVGYEGSGRLPTPQQRNRNFEENTAPDSPCGKEVCLDKGEVTDRTWSVGDNVNLAVGQGDLQADPLQMAVAYAAIANGGDIVRPHVGKSVQDPEGRTIQEIDPAIRDHVDIDPAAQRTILDGLHGAAMEPGGTSYKVFGGYPVDIAGKTGTAETGINIDQSWYIALAPYDNPKYVVAVTVERGGFGVDTAAPAARLILDQLLGVNEAKVETVGSGGGVVE
ncbi:MAG: penicillin-binding protein 2 [Solirubrobacterales bacterium]|jgi:penicillin-binding protein 2|nr:penicillin-binding protein 2 [Solirubrobacterales bacterium]